MSHSMDCPLVYSASPGPMTDPGEYAALFNELPTGIPQLVEDEKDLEFEIMDRIAALSLARDGVLSEKRDTYARDSRFHIPTEWLPAGGDA